MRCKEGGFVRVPRPNSRLKLARLLDQNVDVKNVVMEKFKSADRSIYDPNASINRSSLQERE